MNRIWFAALPISAPTPMKFRTFGWLLVFRLLKVSPTEDPGAVLTWVSTFWPYW